MYAGQPVVLGVEDRVHRGQRDVLVATSVTRDEVNTEQLVVVRRAVAVIGERIRVVHAARVRGLEPGGTGHSPGLDRPGAAWWAMSFRNS